MDGGSILEMFAFYRAAAPRRRQQMVAAAVRVTLEAGAYYFHAGSPCDSVAFVGSGRVRVVKRSEDGHEIGLYHVGAGETCLLTLIGALTGDAYPADAVVDENVEAAMVAVSDFRAWVETDGPFRDYVLREITERTVQLMQLVEEVAFQRVDRRLAVHLLEATCGPGDGAVLATHQEIAAELGASRETVSRVLKELERRGLLQLSRGSIRVLDRNGLRAYETSA